MFVLTKEGMRRAEEYAHEYRGLTFYSMMDMAGTKCAKYIAELEDAENRVVILCGKGKNGGDGLVIARNLYTFGFTNIFVILTDGKSRDEVSYKMLNEMRKYPVNIINMFDHPSTALGIIRSADVIVDAMFGIGFKGNLDGNNLNACIEANLNENAVKYAIDIPSGISSDGTYSGEYFHTDYTLTIISFKPAHVWKPTADLCGKTVVLKIGMQNEDLEQFAEKYMVLYPDELMVRLKKRKYNSNKGDFGKVFIIAGSYQMTGCTYLAAQAAVEAGAGLVTLAFPDVIYNTVTPKLTESTFMPLPSNDEGRILSAAEISIGERLKTSSICAIGCGTGVDDDIKELTEFIIKNSPCPVILDADALNSIAGKPDILKEAKSEILITPHPGEMARLLRTTAEKVNEDRISTSSDFAKKYNVNVLLKGSNTIIASPDGRICVNPTGNPGMSRGGSGDVLTGIIAGLYPQSDSLFAAACLGAYIHGGAADYVAENCGFLAATPTRVLDNLHEYLMGIEDDIKTLR